MNMEPADGLLLLQVLTSIALENTNPAVSLLYGRFNNMLSFPLRRRVSLNTARSEQGATSFASGTAPIQGENTNRFTRFEDSGEKTKLLEPGICHA